MRAHAYAVVETHPEVVVVGVLMILGFESIDLTYMMNQLLSRETWIF